MEKSTYEVKYSNSIDAETEDEAIREFRKLVVTVDASCFDVVKVADDLSDGCTS